MELKDICIDLEYAKRLKELGVKQESICWWIPNQNEWKVVNWKKSVVKNYCYNGHPVKFYSAYTSAELLERLPIIINKDDIDFTLSIYRLRSDEGVRVIYDTLIEGDLIVLNDIWQNYDKKLCNALAKMYIYLIENKLFKVKS